MSHLELVTLVVDDYDPAIEFFVGVYDRMVDAGVQFTGSPRAEAYGQVAVFFDICGNRWDLLGP